MIAEPANEGIRKAAILVASLDRATADLVLDQMRAEEAQAVRRAILEMGEMDPQEQRAIVAEFRRRRAPADRQTSEVSKIPQVSPKTPPGVELDAGLARKFVPPSLDRRGPEASVSGPSGPPFRFLREAEIDKLARVLVAERPQTIALVLSHMPPQHAGNLLARLDDGLQVDVLRRLADLEETDPVILREVERGLQSRLSEQVRMQRRRVAGLAAVTGILDACDERVSAQILDNLNTYDKPLAERLGPGPATVEFADLVGLEDETLAAALQAADPEWILLALLGAPPDWIERFLRVVPESEARQVRHDLTHLGPTRLSDVEEARQRLAALAQRLAGEGRIRLPEKAQMLTTNR